MGTHGRSSVGKNSNSGLGIVADPPRLPGHAAPSSDNHCAPDPRGFHPVRIATLAVVTRGLVPCVPPVEALNLPKQDRRVKPGDDELREVAVSNKRDSL
jgi:hypothetical protein